MNNWLEVSVEKHSSLATDRLMFHVLASRYRINFRRLEQSTRCVEIRLKLNNDNLIIQVG